MRLKSGSSLAAAEAAAAAEGGGEESSGVAFNHPATPMPIMEMELRAPVRIVSAARRN